MLNKKDILLNSRENLISSIRITKINLEQLKKFIKLELKNKPNDFDDLLYTEPSGLTYETVFGIYLNDLMIGYISLAKYNLGHCEKLYINKNYRKNGIAKHVVNWLHVRSLYVLEQNTEAVAFYIKIGFKIKHNDRGMLTMTRTSANIKPAFLSW